MWLTLINHRLSQFSTRSFIYHLVYICESKLTHHFIRGAQLFKESAVPHAGCWTAFLPFLPTTSPSRLKFSYTLISNNKKWALTRAYLWPAVKKRPISFWPVYFFDSTRSHFLSEGKKIGKFGIFRGNLPYQNTNQRCLTRDKFFWPRPIANIFSKSHINDWFQIIL